MEHHIALVVGLGNPGSEYARTRHNAGFWFVEALAEKFGGRFTANKKLHGELAEIGIGTARLRLLKPMTFMNLSGQAAAATLAYYKIAPGNMLVAYDEIDFPPGKIRLKFDGGHAGHNGIRSIIGHIGPAFWRMRIGVGHPGERSEVVSHVLKRASGADESAIMGTIASGVDVIPTLVQDGPEKAQLDLHTEQNNGN
jgi:PTH1 family peptidyl-tRNA hydrolase